jgi:hypothetical protein
VIEGKTFKGEYRIILCDRKMVGVQMVGDNGIAPMFNLIYQRKDRSFIENALKSNNFIRKNPFYYSWFKKYLG